MTRLPVIAPIAKFFNESSLKIWISHHVGHKQHVIMSKTLCSDP